MPENERYLPEGLRPPVPLTLADLQAAKDSGQILEGVVQRCGTDSSLHLRLGPAACRIPREEAIAPWISGAARDIALLSRVGRPICFKVKDLSADGRGAPTALLSRRDAQEEAAAWFLEHLSPGMVLVCRVTHMEPFGAFLDIGCGIIAMLPIEYISVSRITHPRERFTVGQKLLAAVSSIDPAIPRFTMTHRELLGTWMDNASRFRPGETVQGIVRSVRDYGAFVELTPNLSGLADLRQPVSQGDRVSVYIRSIRPERMKIKLQIIDRLPPREGPPPAIRYRVTDGQLDRWVYSPPGCLKPVTETVFLTPDGP